MVELRDINKEDDLLDNKIIELFIPKVDEFGEQLSGKLLEDKNNWKYNTNFELDMLTMNPIKKGKFMEKFPNIMVNPAYARPILFFLPVKSRKDLVENQIPYYIKKNIATYFESFGTNMGIFLFTWFFGLNATLFAIRARNPKLREYDFPTNTDFKPYTKLDSNEENKYEINKSRIGEHSQNMENGHYHDNNGNYKTAKEENNNHTGGGSKMDKLNELFDNLEKNIDKSKIQKGGSKIQKGGSKIQKGGNLFLEEVFQGSQPIVNGRKNDDKIPGDSGNGAEFGMTRDYKRHIKIPGDSGNEAEFGMTRDYEKDGTHPKITQYVINTEAGGDGWEEEAAFWSSGPNAASGGGLCGLGRHERNKQWNQFFSYVMRNSTWMLNCGFNNIFKFFGEKFENTTEEGGEEGGEYGKHKSRLILFIHLFAIFSLFFSSYIILISSFFIVLFSIISYAFMSEYSGPAAYTLILDGFFGLGSLALRKIPVLGGLGFGALLFLIPSVWTFVAAIFIPIILAFKKIVFLLFGYSFSEYYKYGWQWIWENITENKAFLIFEILLLHSISVKNYYPDGGSFFSQSIMIDGFGTFAPAGAALMLLIKQWKNKGIPITVVTLLLTWGLVHYIHKFV